MKKKKFSIAKILLLASTFAVMTFGMIPTVIASDCGIFCDGDPSRICSVCEESGTTIYVYGGGGPIIIEL